MNDDDIIRGVKDETAWWLEMRLRKITQAQHESMEINPFLAPLIFSLHGHTNFHDLADFLLSGHFAIGHATGFGKLIDEKILPKVFGTRKLDRAARNGLFARSCFDNIDHVITRGQSEYLLSLKASKWTIQLGQAVELNRSFAEIEDLRRAHHHNFDRIIIATFYGTQDGLTDKYRLVRGISNGANHDVVDLTNFVSILSGNDFWAWIGENVNTQFLVMEGILEAINQMRDHLGSAQGSLGDAKIQFANSFNRYIGETGRINWEEFLRAINGPADQRSSI